MDKESDQPTVVPLAFRSDWNGHSDSRATTERKVAGNFEGDLFCSAGNRQEDLLWRIYGLRNTTTKTAVAAIARTL